MFLDHDLRYDLSRLCSYFRTGTLQIIALGDDDYEIIDDDIGSESA